MGASFKCLLWGGAHPGLATPPRLGIPLPPSRNCIPHCPWPRAQARARQRRRYLSGAAVVLQARARVRFALRIAKRARWERRLRAVRWAASSRIVQRGLRARHAVRVAAAVRIQRRALRWRAGSEVAVGYLLRLCNYRLSCHARALEARPALSPAERGHAVALPLWR